MGVGLQGQAEGACKAEIRDFEELARLIDQQITRLQISMHDPPFMTMKQPH